MKVSQDLAQVVAQMRHRFVAELLLYTDETMPIEAAIANAMALSRNRKCDYIANAPLETNFDASRVKAIASGKLQCPAYLSQSALDYVLDMGYCSTPELVVGMWLTRRDVSDVRDVANLLPQHWSEEEKALALEVAKREIDKALYENMVKPSSREEQ
ncbi:TPA: hypothetical protein I7682_17915 [Vibrio vulnificus]|nr:hypothetical protein [Vibrio vulnificus]